MSAALFHCHRSWSHTYKNELDWTVANSLHAHLTHSCSTRALPLSIRPTQHPKPRDLDSNSFASIFAIIAVAFVNHHFSTGQYRRLDSNTTHSSINQSADPVRLVAHCRFSCTALEQERLFRLSLYNKIDQKVWSDELVFSKRHDLLWLRSQSLATSFNYSRGN